MRAERFNLWFNSKDSRKQKFYLCDNLGLICFDGPDMRSRVQQKTWGFKRGNTKMGSSKYMRFWKGKMSIKRHELFGSIKALVKIGQNLVGSIKTHESRQFWIEMSYVLAFHSCCAALWISSLFSVQIIEKRIILLVFYFWGGWKLKIPKSGLRCHL